MKKILILAAALITFSCTKEKETTVTLNETTNSTVPSIEGEWIHSHSVFKNYYYLKENNLLNSSDTTINERVLISKDYWGNDKVSLFMVEKEYRVQFLDTNRYFYVEKYFPDRMVINENNTTTHFYFR